MRKKKNTTWTCQTSQAHLEVFGKLSHNELQYIMIGQEQPQSEESWSLVWKSHCVLCNPNTSQPLRV